MNGQLEAAREDLREALEELKKFELLEERDQIRERQEREAAEQDDLDEVASRRKTRI